MRPLWLFMLLLLTSCGGGTSETGNAAGSQEGNANQPLGKPAWVPAAEPRIGSARLGFSFAQNGLSPRPHYGPNTTLLIAHIYPSGSDEYAYLVVDWVSPRDRAEHTNGLRAEMTSAGFKETSREEVSFADGKGVSICFNHPEAGEVRHLIENAEDDQWFFHIRCHAVGTNARADGEVLSTAVNSFSTDMGNTSGATHVDRVFGFHIALNGIKRIARIWNSIEPMEWELKGGGKTIGILGVRVVRRDAEPAEYLRAYRERVSKGWKMGAEQEVELAGRKGVSLRTERMWAGEQYYREEVAICNAGDFAWHVEITWFGGTSEKVVALLRETMQTLKLPEAK